MRPLFLYAVPAILNAYFKAITFRSWGLRNVSDSAVNASNKQYSDGNIDYLVRIPPGWTPSRSKDTGLPVIYLHGLGFGLVSPTPLPG
jgi:hypothetical protein